MVDVKKEGDQKVYFIIFTIFVILLLAVLYYFAIYKKDEVEISTKEISKEEKSSKEEIAQENEEDNENKSTEEREEIDISNWQTYENEEYGFSLKYPKEFNDKNIYNLWETKDSDSLFLYQWGANKGQETIISISVYDKNKENSVIEKYDYHISDEEILLKNNKKAKKVSMGISDYKDVLFIENSKYLYVIYSLFTVSDKNLEEYKFFNGILSNIFIE